MPEIESTHIVVTVHGIRTFGRWQERLKRLLEAAEPGIHVLNYNYGWFSIIAFIIPVLRWFATLQFRRELVSVAKAFPGARVDLVGHSFGTHLIGWSVRRMLASKRPRIHNVILAGSVLRPGFRWGELLRAGAIRRLINECGTHDAVLVLNQAVVLLTGVAGILGFKGLTSDVFRNSWHRFGHSGYFRREGIDSDDFMASRWVPLLTRDDLPELVDDRPQTTPYGVWVVILQNLEIAKLVVYAGCVVAAVSWYRGVVETRATATARRLAAQSERVRTIQPQRIPESLLLAVESMRTAATIEGDTALRRSLALFPVVEGTIPHSGKVSFVSFSPDDRFVATASDDRTVRIWNANERHDVRSFTVDATVLALAWSSDIHEDRLFASTEGGTFWTADSAGVRTVPMAAGNSNRATIGERNGMPIVGLVQDGFKVQVRSVRPDRVLGEVSHEQVITVAFSPDGHFAATSGYDGVVRVWSFTDRLRLSELLQHDEPVSAVAFSPGVGRVAFGDKFGGVIVRDLASKRDEFRAEHSGPVTSLAFSPDGRWLVTGSGDGTARVWDCGTGRELARMVNEENVADVAFSHDGSRVAVAGGQMVRIWSFATPLPLDPPGILSAMAFGPDGRALYSGDSYGNIDVVHLTGRAAVDRLRHASGQETAVLALSSAKRDHALVAAFDDGAVRMWENGRLSQETTVQLVGSACFTAMAITADGRLIAAGDWDGSILLFNSDGTRIASTAFEHKDAISALAFSRDAEYLAVGLADALEIWEIRTGRKVSAWPMEGEASMVVFSSGGDMLLTNDGNAARLWAWRSGTLAARIDSYGQPSAAAFTADDRFVVIGSGNRTARRALLWPVDASSLIREGCGRLAAYYNAESAQRGLGYEQYVKVCPALRY